MPIKVDPNELVPVKVDPAELVPVSDKAPEKDLNALERTALSYGTGAWEGLRKAANWSFGMPSAPGFIQDPAVKEGAAKLRKITEGHPYSGELPAFVGELVGPTVATAPLGAPAAGVKALPALARLAVRAGSGAAQGAIGSGMQGGDEGVGAGVGGVLGVAGPAALSYLKKGGQRASESAVRLLSSGASTIDELADRFATKGGTVEGALRSAGSTLRSIGRGGKRLVGPGMEAGERGLMLAQEGEDAGKIINSVMREADARGLKGSPQEIVTQLREARDRVLGVGPGSRLTDEQIAAKAKIDEHIARFMKEFQTQVKPGAVNPGALPEEATPLVMREHPDTGGLVRNPKGDQILAESRVGSADELWRSKTPTPEGFQQSKYGRPGTPAARSEPTTRGQPLRRNQYLPQEVTREAQPGAGSAFQNIDFEDLPLSEYEEGAKRAYQTAAFLRKGSGAYRTSDAAKADPMNQWLRQASGILRGHTEEKLPADLLSRFQPAKARSGIAQTMRESADDVAKARFSNDPGVGGSKEGTLYRMFVREPMQAARPYLIAGNEGMEKLANNLPEGTQEAIMNAVIKMLKEKQYAP